MLQVPAVSKPHVKQLEKHLICSAPVHLQVEVKTTPETPDAGNLQRAADFVHAFILGFEVQVRGLRGQSRRGQQPHPPALRQHVQLSRVPPTRSACGGRFPQRFPEPQVPAPARLATPSARRLPAYAGRDCAAAAGRPVHRVL